MPVFVSTSVFENGTPVTDAVEKLISMDIRNIELASIHSPEDGLEEKLGRFKAEFITHNFFPPREGRLVLNLASADEKIRRESLAFMKQAIDFAEKIGAGVYTIHPGFLVDPVGESASRENYDFRFPDQTKPFSSEEYARHFDFFLRSLNEISRYLTDKSVKVAVETQGSVTHKEHVLFSRPDDFTKLLECVEDKRIGINLNLGHLNLAAAAWGFDRGNCVDRLRAKIFAVEVTHNNGAHDDHQVLKEDGWYMEVLNDDFYKTVPVIFEGRFISPEDIGRSHQMLCEIAG